MSGLRLKLGCRGEKGFELELDCELPGTGVTAVYGPSGSGKSTLLDCIAGLRATEAGSQIQLRGSQWQQDSQLTPVWRRRIGYVFQDARLFPHLNTLENLQYAVQRRVVDDGTSLQQVIDWLDLEPLLSHPPDALSAGQRQRVAIGRALLSAPVMLLLDEPLANLDSAASRQCLNYLRRVIRKLELPVLYVSHDMEEVSQLADHLLLLENGRVTGQGSLLEMSSRLDSNLAHEEQAAAIAVGRITRHDPDFGLTELDLEGQVMWVNHLDQAPGQMRRLRIAARDVSVCRQRPADSSILNILAVKLADMERGEQDSSRIMLRLEVGSQFLLARITRKSAAQLQLKVGDPLFAQIKSAALLNEEFTNT